jgi:valyl-tRNA synthetase
LNELTTLQKNYFFYFKKKEINLATAQLIKFTRERLSREYLELIKVFLWSKNTKNTLLFVYQQLLLLFHPSIPYVTEYIYQEITQQKILEAEIEVFSGETRNNKLWQVDCLLLLIGSIRQVRKKSQVSEFYLELTPE